MIPPSAVVEDAARVCSSLWAAGFTVEDLAPMVPGLPPRVLNATLASMVTRGRLAVAGEVPSLRRTSKRRRLRVYVLLSSEEAK